MIGTCAWRATLTAVDSLKSTRGGAETLPRGNIWKPPHQQQGPLPGSPHAPYLLKAFANSSITCRNYAARPAQERRWHPTQEVTVLDARGNKVEVRFEVGRLEEVSRRRYRGSSAIKRIPPPIRSRRISAGMPDQLPPGPITPQDWTQIGHNDFGPTKNPEAFQLRDSLIIRKKCSKEDSNLHGLPH